MTPPPLQELAARITALTTVAPRNAVVLGLCLLLAAGAAVPLTAVADGHEITTENRVDVPARTVTVAGQSFTVDSTGYVRAGEDLSVAVDIPGGDMYQVVLYNSRSEIEERVTKVEDGTVSFETDQRPPGSYVVTVWEDGELRAIQPVVVSGYDVSVDAPDEVTAGSSATVTATISSISGAPDDPAHVNVVVFNDTWDGRYAATLSDGTYTADLPETLAPGEYSVYVTAHSDDEYNGQFEVSGVSGASSITVAAGQNAPPGGNDGDEDTPTPDDTPTPGDTVEESTTESSVIEPADATAGGSTETTAPGFPVLGFVLLALTGAWMHVRSRGRS